MEETSTTAWFAIRTESGEFVSNPAPTTTLHPGQVLIAIGTRAELDALRRINGG